jgi:hypothetical protein
MKEIPLNGKVGAGLSVMVNDEDFEWLSEYSFTLIDSRRHKKPQNYRFVKTNIITTSRKRTSVTIQHLIMGKAPKGYKIDHIDRDTLNNQRDNLRFVTNRVSSHNQSVKGVSRYRGVTWDKEHQSWRTQIISQGRRYNLGRFRDDVTAARNFDYYALCIYGEYAVLNFTDFDYSNFVPKRRIDELLNKESTNEQPFKPVSRDS